MSIAYVPLSMRRWGELEITMSVRLDTSRMPGIGYLLVFATLADLQREYPDAPYAEIRIHDMEARDD